MVTKEVVFYNDGNLDLESNLPAANLSKYKNVVFIKGIPVKVKSSAVKSMFESYLNEDIVEKFSNFSDNVEDVLQIKNFLKQNHSKDFKTLEYINVFR